jgi:hypothetical protein
MSDHIPRMEVELTLAAEECADCGGGPRRIGEDVTEELEYVPGRFIVNRVDLPAPIMQKGAKQPKVVQMTQSNPMTVVAAVMQPVADLDVPPVLRASIERQSQTLLGLASSLLQGGVDEKRVRSVVDQAFESYREELIAAILALGEQDGS